MSLCEMMHWAQQDSSLFHWDKSKKIFWNISFSLKKKKKYIQFGFCEIDFC